MLCKVCNTRVPGHQASCPNCGSHTLAETPNSESALTAKLPQIDYPTMDEASGDPEIEWADDSDSLDLEDAVEPEKKPAVRVTRSQPSREPAKPAAPSAANAAAPGNPNASGVRRMLCERPQMLEPGLTVYTSEKGTPLGAGYKSAVGPIDLLARDAKGDLVVVMVAEPDDGPEVISVALQRIGWVRKHLSPNGRPVRGVVLLDSVREGITYAASAVSETLQFKTYRIALAFDDVEF